MSLGRILEIYIALVKRKAGGDAEEARRYMYTLQEKAKEIYTYINNLEEDNKRMKQKTANYTTIQQINRDMSLKLKELENTIENHSKQETPHEQAQDYMKMMEETSIRECEANEKLEQYQRQLEEKEEIIRQYIEQDEQGLTPTNYRTILGMLQKISQQKEKREIITNKNEIIIPEKENSSYQAQEQKQDYPNVPKKKIDNRVHTVFSKSAVLVKRQATNMSINDIRVILQRETKNKIQDNQIYCETAKDNNTLIIKGTTEENTNKLLEIIEKIETLKNITEIIFKAANLKKFIVMGIPKYLKKEDTINKIQEYYQTEIPIALVKEITRPDSNRYQLVMEAEDWIVDHITKQGGLAIGFLNLRAAQYFPILRCNKCQRFGHVERRCRVDEVCRYCAKPHKSQFCPLRKEPQRHRCVNCYGTNKDFPHSANSPECPTFQYNVHRRNTLATTKQQHSVPY